MRFKLQPYFFARRGRPAGRAQYAPTRRRISRLGFEKRASVDRIYIITS
jgi:hypothetical protein